eukprot:1188346-Prorocentrum_minimum.AAC.3
MMANQVPLNPGKMGSSSSNEEYKYSRMESGIPESLAPGFSQGENMLRLGFIRFVTLRIDKFSDGRDQTSCLFQTNGKKVYGILSCQLILTAAVAGWIASSPSTRDAIMQTPGMMTLAGIAPFLGLMPLFCYRNSHPLNLALLAVWLSAENTECLRLWGISQWQLSIIGTSNIIAVLKTNSAHLTALNPPRLDCGNWCMFEQTCAIAFSVGVVTSVYSSECLPSLSPLDSFVTLHPFHPCP